MGSVVYGAVPHGLRGDGPRAGMCSCSQTSCDTAATCITVSPYRDLIQSLPAMSEEGEKGKGKENEPLQLDAQALEAIIKGVVSKLQEECKGRKPGEHSGSETA